MSGIVGLCRGRGDPVDPADLRRMLATMPSRGPDGESVWTSGVVGLGCGLRRTTRESFGERQPFEWAPGEAVIVADARLDNREDLRELELDLDAGPLRGRGSTPIPDSAIILAAYRRWGEACVERLEGDFALLIWDPPNRRFFAARDPFGVRPLFYALDASGFVAWASEIKALLALESLPRKLNPLRVGYHLAGFFDDPEETFYQGIRRLPAGHAAVVREGQCTVRRYFRLDDRRIRRMGGDEEYAEEFRRLFLRAVERRAASSDAPVVSTLSGGLDSTSIACAVRKLFEPSGRTLHTVSAVFPSLTGKERARIDERSFVDDALAQGGMEPRFLEVDQLSPLLDFEAILRLTDEPILAPNFYMHWAMYGAAQKVGARVFLDGLDGDTTLSHGYEYLFNQLVGFRPLRAYREARALAEHTRSMGYGTRRLLREFALDPLTGWLRHHLTRAWRRPDPQPWGDFSLIDPQFAASIDLPDRIHAIRGRRPPVVGGWAHHRDGLLSPLLPHAMEIADAGTTAHGLEGRYPFCDLKLVEFCLSLPGDQKLRGGLSRFVLRQGMRGILPDSVRLRTSKADLSPGLYRGLLRFEGDRIRLAAERIEETGRGFVDAAGFREAVRRYRDGDLSQAFRLYGVLSLLAWLETPSGQC